MNLNKIYNFENINGVSDIYTLTGSCGTFDGYDSITSATEDGFVAMQKDFTLKAEITNENGVFMRSDVIENISEQDLNIYNYAYRFCLEGGEFDVYTQLTHWQNESCGEWQRLVTEISASSKKMYTNIDATPMAAVWNRQTNRGVVFHLLPQFAWRICVSKRTVSKRVYTVIEISVNDPGLNLAVSPKDRIDFSSVIYYEFTDKSSLDCHKLHRFFNKRYPRRDLPVMYNTWLAFFDDLSFETSCEQVREAADIGCEYFVIDAGWFGDGNERWGNLIGQWTENKSGAYMGRMRELSDYVHQSGMKFGLWLEVERALDNVESVRKHPEYFFNNDKNNREYFLDFANDEAREYITQVTFDLIEKYRIDYIKFDFNSCLAYDKTRCAFYDYHKGHIKYIEEIRKQYPKLYLECCAGGGYRMELENLRHFDSFWFSDNQSPYDGLEIIKNTIKRMPPSAMDRWGVVVSCDGFIPAYGTDETMRTLAIDNGTWDEVVGVTPEFMCGFFSGGAPAFSCDLTKLSSGVKDKFKNFISDFKKERSFWKDAACRILCDTESVLVLQYENNGEIKIVVYTFKLTQRSITVYPVVENREYTVNGEVRSFEDIITNGIIIENPKNRYSYTITLK